MKVLPDYVKVEMDVYRLLREDCSKVIAVEIPEDYEDELEDDEHDDFDGE